ncbi:MAG: hypothetical protein K6T63_12935 [Alicyclobacillus herbarius]|uniref:hypothetical protein n=1 Tax=Alicyclobacillus herbarius TaxID=122960 RepID=UPI0023579C9B|nr:hypothetical protein [Alicyclobacillus herbarius]MCL6633522.1 hypothetical protein [Alicyclobacillus herbarius]
MVTRAHCMRLTGQHVVFRTRDGVTHHGILHSVTDDGIYIRAVGGKSTRLANGKAGDLDSVHLLQDSRQTLDDTEQAWWPFFFFPFFALWWLWPWAWW